MFLLKTSLLAAALALQAPASTPPPTPPPAPPTLAQPDADALRILVLEEENLALQIEALNGRIQRQRGELAERRRALASKLEKAHAGWVLPDGARELTPKPPEPKPTDAKP